MLLLHRFELGKFNSSTLILLLNFQKVISLFAAYTGIGEDYVCHWEPAWRLYSDGFLTSFLERANECRTELILSGRQSAAHG